MPERYHIDFSQMTMNTSLSTDKRIPPLYTLVKNADPSIDGKFKRRGGYTDLSTNASPNAGSVAINAVCPTILGDTGTVLANGVAITATPKLYSLALRASTWNDEGVTPTSTFPWQFAWGLNASQQQVVYLAPSSAVAGGTVYSVRHAVGTTVLLGQGANGFVTARCCAYFLNRLWVGASAKSGSVVNDLVQYSVAGDDNDFNGTGSGTLSLKPPYGLNNGMEAMAVYNGRLYFGAGASLMVLTGTTPSTFGSQFVQRVNIINGATFYPVGGFLWWVDIDGIWQFNGSTAQNIALRDMAYFFNTELTLTDKLTASMSWDESQGLIRLCFPTANVTIEYNYIHRTWAKIVYAGTRAINVIGPPCSKLLGGNVNYLLGAANTGEVFVQNDSTLTDDGNTVISSFQSGYIHLAAMSNQGTYGDDFRLVALELHVAKRSVAITYKMDWQTDTQPTAESQKTLTVAAASSDQDYPSVINANALLPTHRTGKYLSFTLTEDTAAARGDLRGMTFYFDVMKRN